MPERVFGDRDRQPWEQGQSLLLMTYSSHFIFSVRTLAPATSLGMLFKPATMRICSHGVSLAAFWRIPRRELEGVWSRY